MAAFVTSPSFSLPNITPNITKSRKKMFGSLSVGVELAGSEEKQLVFESETPRRLFFSDYRQTSSKEEAVTELGSDDASINRLRGRLLGEKDETGN